MQEVRRLVESDMVTNTVLACLQLTASDLEQGHEVGWRYPERCRTQLFERAQLELRAAALGRYANPLQDAQCRPSSTSHSAPHHDTVQVILTDGNTVDTDVDSRGRRVST